MPLSPPHLDDRRYDELFDSLKRRIPVYNPGWTDHNDSDPGITLLQLFAFMTESVLFRLNQVPEATQMTFLRLLEMKLRPATPARCLVAFRCEVATGIVVQQDLRLAAGKLPFRLEMPGDLHVWPVEALGVARKATATPSDHEDGQPGGADDPELYDVFQARLEALEDALNLPEGGLAVQAYAPEYLRPGAAGRLGLADTVDQSLWIALLCTKPGVLPDFGGSATGQVSLAFDLAAQDNGLGTAITACDAGPAGGAGGDLVVELAEQGLEGAVSYRRLQVVADTTAGLARSGILRVSLPSTASRSAWPALPDDLDGAGDRPPPLGEADRERLWQWLRLRRRNGVPPDLARLSTNAAGAVQARPLEPVILGMGTGQPGQVFALPGGGPIIGGDPALALRIEVEEEGQWRPWQEIEALDLASEDARVFALDAEAAEVRFAAHGPALGSRVRLAAGFQGGGSAGNVALGALTRIDVPPPGLTVANISSGRGGAEAETLDQALLRIPGELRRRDRAVTSEDFRELAMLTPGAGLGRAECLARFHPRSLQWEQPGIVSVMVWPQDMPVDGNPPVPDRVTIAQVCTQLSARRLVTTELYVIPPDYVDIAVSVRIAVEPGYSTLAVTTWVERILKQFLSPLPPHGPDGQGWPLGRAVNPRELEATVLQVQGVDFVEELRLARRDGEAWVEGGTVAIRPEQVVWLRQAVAVGPGAVLPPPGQDAPPPATGPLPVPVPLIREVC